jgi:hypothetical protein
MTLQRSGRAGVCILALASWLTAGSGVRADMIVYDNTTNPILADVFTSIRTQLGDEITLAGTAREMVRLELLVRPSGATALADTTVRLYANDGAGGAPGTLLYAAFLPQVFYAAPGTLLGVDIPQVLVPDTFTWTIEYDNISGSANLGLRVYDPPTVGSSEDFFWRSSPATGFQRQDPSGFPGNFYARVVATGGDEPAIPEPATLTLLGIGALGLLGYGWRRRKQLP